MEVRNSQGDVARTLVRVAENQVINLIGQLEVDYKKLHSTKARLEKRLGRKITMDQLEGVDPKLYRRLRRNSKAFKSLRRGLGSLVTTSPDFLGDNGLLATLEKLDPNDADFLNNTKKALDNWDSNLAYYKEGLNKFRTEKLTVGHHPISLSTLRDELADLGKTVDGFQLRNEIVKLAKKEGFQLGEEFIQHIDPLAHKFDKAIKGRLQKMFPGADLDSAQFKPIIAAAKDRFAHAYWAGGTGGIDIPKGLIPRNATAAEALELIKPSLIIQQEGSKSAGNFHKLLNKVLHEIETGDFPKGQEQKLATLLSRINELPVPDVSEYWSAAKENKIISGSRYKTFLTKTAAYVGGGGALLTLPNIANAAEIGIPNPETVDLAQKGLWGQAATSYGKELLFEGGAIAGITGSTLGVAKLAQIAGVPMVARGIQAFGGVMTGPPGWLATGGSILYQLDESFNEGKGLRYLKETGNLAEIRKQQEQEAGYSYWDQRRAARHGRKLPLPDDPQPSQDPLEGILSPLEQEMLW